MRHSEILIDAAVAGDDEQESCPVQVTPNSLTGWWAEKALKTAHWLLRRQSARNRERLPQCEARSPILSSARTALEKSDGTDLANALTHNNPLAIVENWPLPFFPPIKA